MKRTYLIPCCALSALVSACAGTIDDPNLFQRGSYNASSLREAGLPNEEEEERDQPSAPSEEDAGTEAGSPATRDAGAGNADASAPGWAMDGAVSDARAVWPVDALINETSASGASTRDAASSNDGGSARADAGGACDFRALVASKCGNAGCHGGAAVSTGLDLTSEQLAVRVAGRKGSGACASYLLIDTEQPERSALYLKVTADACGSRMPLGGTLTDSEQACILQWITNL
jgi:hypothetical protein